MTNNNVYINMKVCMKKQHHRELPLPKMLKYNDGSNYNIHINFHTRCDLGKNGIFCLHMLLYVLFTKNQALISVDQGFGEDLAALII